nr:MAG TPA: hypothetical protein [Caudoviricetes sp.]
MSFICTIPPIFPLNTAFSVSIEEAAKAGKF